MAGGRIIIKTENLTKKYQNKTAVSSLNLEIEEGEIFGLLGPNGAGKTTTILMLLGLTEPNEGRAWIDGYDCTRNPIAVKSIVGYLPDNVGFYGDMTGRENLRYTGLLNGMDEKELERRIDFLIERVGLRDSADKKVATYSRGMRQRLGIADVLIKNPKVVILDEPTLGIDPEGIREMFALITELSRKDKRTVLISSHLLHQVQQICDRVGIFVDGSLLAAGRIDELGEQVLKGQSKIIELKALPENDELQRIIKAADGVKKVERDRGMIVVHSDYDIRSELAHLIIKNGFSLLHLRLRGGDLDDIYRCYFAKEGVA